ncbi:pancreatic triacylglycerol lipase-like, partial [Aphidius gifuensis]|uniref:pancreatic triacylglycerol lipase-like n=1 Tax=Aphidius gifuensis TaxID=684658 RepID=UPI001CDB9A3D
FKGLSKASHVINEIEEINLIKLNLYTRKNPNNSYILKFDDKENLNNSPLNPIDSTKIIIHGWKDSSNCSECYWMNNFRDNYLLVGNYNVILIDWSSISKEKYFKAVNASYSIGYKVAEFIDFFKIIKNISLNDVHILGHSLGAHIAGYAGYFLNGKIGRITAMDPAAPFFEYPKIMNGVERYHAKFVDVIHTCGGPLSPGYKAEIGHCDYYPNGGKCKQPGCTKKNDPTCSHQRAYQYMIESIINPHGFLAIKCDKWKNYKKGKCNSKIAVFMGENVSQKIRGQFYLETNNATPFGKG